MNYKLVYLVDIINLIDMGCYESHNENVKYSLRVRISDNDNNDVIINTDTKDEMQFLPKSVDEIIKKTPLLQEFIAKYNNNYFLYINVTYFDGFIESFYIQVENLKSMFA
jgi:hypothetical protein